MSAIVYLVTVTALECVAERPDCSWVFPCVSQFALTRSDHQLLLEVAEGCFPDIEVSVLSRAPCEGSASRWGAKPPQASKPIGQLTPVPPIEQYPPGFLWRYCW
jgi:hypothetical protein